MGTCSACGASFDLKLCPHSGGSAALTQRQINRTLVKYSYPAFGGLVGIVIANGLFPLLDCDAFFVVGLCAFFAPVVLHIVSSFRKRLAADTGRVQQAYLYAGGVTVFLALLIGCNGGMDQSPATLVRTTVVAKQVTVGRYGRASYSLRVRSWRAGRTTEDFSVGGRTYRLSSMGKGVVVEVHRGRWGLPWYSGVSSE